MEENVLHIDKELFARMSRGEEDAFRQIVRYYHKRLLPLTITLVKSEPEARDIMQEVFLKLWLNRLELAGVDNPGGWLRVVTTNTVSNHIRSQLRYALGIKNLKEESADEANDVLGELDTRFSQYVINEAVNRLPEKRKQVFLLSRREGLSRREIAAKLNISENTVRNQLAEAIKSLQDYLRKDGALIIPAFLLLLTDMH